MRIYAEALDGKLYHYRDSSGLECDAVIHLRNGRYALLEVKLGGSERIEEGACSLKALADKIDTDKMPTPSFWPLSSEWANTHTNVKTEYTLSLSAASKINLRLGLGSFVHISLNKSLTIH